MLKKLIQFFKTSEPLIEDIEKVVSRYNLEESHGKVHSDNLPKIGKKKVVFLEK